MEKHVAKSYSKLISFYLIAFLFNSANVTANQNILLIIADDFGVDSHGLYSVGSDTAPTPTINSLAAQGIRFDRAWSNPRCSPTRATIATGRYSFRTNVGSPEGNYWLHSDEYTIAQALKSQGYDTAIFGKWHLGAASSLLPTRRGFDYYAGSPSGVLSDYYNWTKTEISTGQITGNTFNETRYATSSNVDDAISWITSQANTNPDNPWFVWLAFNTPHWPLHKPPNELHSYDYLTGTDVDISQNPVPYYQAMVESMDTEINRLLNVVDRENTTIIFLGDNGTWQTNMVSPADPTRDKGSLYEGGVWVPLIVTGPDVVSPNRNSAALVNTVDLFSTIVEIADAHNDVVLPQGSSNDSVSFMSVLKNPHHNSVCSYILTEGFYSPPRAGDGKAIRNDTYKLIRFDLGGEEFYRMSNIPSQYPLDEFDNLLDGTLTADEQTNYDALSSKLNTLLAGEDVDRLCLIDSDGDGVLDSADTFPDDPTETIDSDGDGMGDNADPDDDNDRLTDDIEAMLHTNPLLNDSDSDGILDFDEVNRDGNPSNYLPGTDTDPNNPDTDSDQIIDGSDPNPLVAATTSQAITNPVLILLFALILVMGRYRVNHYGYHE